MTSASEPEIGVKWNLTQKEFGRLIVAQKVYI